MESNVEFKNCPIHFGRDINSTVRAYDSAGVLKKCVRLHNIWEGYVELINERQFLLEKDFRRHLRSKRHMEDPMKRIFKIDIKQSTLAG